MKNRSRSLNVKRCYVGYNWCNPVWNSLHWRSISVGEWRQWMCRNYLKNTTNQKNQTHRSNLLLQSDTVYDLIPYYSKMWPNKVKPMFETWEEITQWSLALIQGLAKNSVTHIPFALLADTGNDKIDKTVHAPLLAINYSMERQSSKTITSSTLSSSVLYELHNQETAHAQKTLKNPTKPCFSLASMLHTSWTSIEHCPFRLLFDRVTISA